MILKKWLIVAALCQFPTAVLANEVDAKAARIMWTAFQCSVYAEKADDTDQQARLFSTGYVAGKRFLTAAQAGTITEAEAQSIVPIGVSLLLGGPSLDFMIGRIFESASNDALDRMYKEDATGMPLEVKNWIVDPLLEIFIAKTKFLQANCDIL